MQFPRDLTWYMRDDLGEWWKGDLYCPSEGMDMLPRSFLKKNENGWNKDVDLSKNIVYGIRVEEVKKKRNGSVEVIGINLQSGAPGRYSGDAVFLTVPLPILRQMNVPLSRKKQIALAGVSYESSTKISLQCKTRFWQKELGQGGFSKTNQVIGQLHYPDYDGSGIPDDARGLLLVYNWGQDALMFGSQTDETAIESALNQISKIHPEIYDEFEVGQVWAWDGDEYAQGAFAALKPYEYLSSVEELNEPEEGIYLAGEALSWSNGWIQGAIFSALAQAFDLQENLETSKHTNMTRLVM